MTHPTPESIVRRFIRAVEDDTIRARDSERQALMDLLADAHRSLTPAPSGQDDQFRQMGETQAERFGQ